MRARLRPDSIGPALLLCSLTFGAVFLAPELELTRVAVNDDVFHLTASERLLDSFRRGEPLLDPWVSEWALGYPVWRSYQPLPHALVAAVLALTESFAEHVTAYAWLKYLLLVLWPASVYAGARGLGLHATAAGLASMLVLAPSGSGELERYGISYGAFVWRGSGLFSQLVALHALALTLGWLARALRDGRQRALAAAALAATGLCHMVFGYVAGISALVMAMAAPSDKRSERAAHLATVAVLASALLVWFIVPLLQSASVINHSRWEAAYKWDSFGAQVILSELVSGRFFDAGRTTFLSPLLLLGLFVAVRHVAEPLPRQLLALTGTWLLLFFGRSTWGQLLHLLCVPSELHLHRLQAAFELSAVLLAAWGLQRMAATIPRRWRPPVLVALALVLGLLAGDRAAYLRQNASWGRESLRAFAAAEPDVRAALADVNALLAEKPGRASAGPAASWGRKFRVGSAPFYAFLSRAHIDQVSFLYHSMSLTSDVMVLRDEAKPAHVAAFALRALVAPSDIQVPQDFKRRASHGRFVVYEGTSEGYFGLVDVTGLYAGPADTRHEPSRSWLQSDLPQAHQVIALPGATVPAALPRIPRWASLPVLPSAGPCGQVRHESKQGEVHSAEVALQRNCYVMLKATWDPQLVARVDGKRTPLLEVTPGFGAVPVQAGTHKIEIAYVPGPVRPVLLTLGILLFACATIWSRLRAGIDFVELQLAAQLERVRASARRMGFSTAIGFALLVIIALRPLLRGKLIAGHDATEYPARLVELARVLADGQIPPVWAPDLGAGYGQPLFEFAPPLVYLAAMPFHALGANLINALQWGLFALHTLGAYGLYRLARQLGAAPGAALGVTAAWLFAPYTALDLYVRGAFAEASAVAVAPLALLWLHGSLTAPSVASVAAAAVGIALVTLGHNGAAILLLPAFGLLALVLLPTLRARVAGAAALTLGLCLSAYFWLPALLEKDLVQTDLLREGFLHWSRHSIAWWQLFYAAWGHGESVAGSQDGMSFAMGWPQLVLGALGLCAALRATRAERRAAVTFGVIVLCGAWLATSASSAVWERVPTLQYLAYPWRALLLPGLFLPLLCVWSLSRLGPRLRLLATGVLVVANVTHTEPKDYLTFDDEYYAPQSIAQNGIRTTTREEYAPRAARVALTFTPTKLLAPEGSLEVINQQLASAHQLFRVRARTATHAELATLAFPGWRARIDGREVPLSTVPRRGTLALEIPAGEHTLQLKLEPTPVRHWSAWLSATLGLCTIAVVSAASLRRRLGARARITIPHALTTEHVSRSRSGMFVSTAPEAQQSSRTP